MATANGNIYATTTAQVGATATSTAQAANVTATAGTFGNIFTNATSGTPALDDPLSDNTGKHKWDVTNGIVGSGCIFTGGAYHAIEDKQGFYQPCFAQATNFSNFAYVVQMTIDSGKQDGIIFRANNTTGSFYLFRIGPDGSYALDVYRNHSFAVTIVSGISAAITTGLKQSNEIAVIANNTTLYLYANKQFIVSVDDNTLSTGQIGVVALDYTNPTVAEFTNAQVWKVTSASLSATPSPSVSPTATESPGATASPSATASPTVSPTTSPTARPTATSTYTP
jgi:hypothetical protein